jgi:hypothetical protein
MAEERPLAIGARGKVAPAARTEQRLSKAALVALVVLMAAGGPQIAGAAGQMRLAQRAEARITVASTIVAQPASLVSLSIQVGPPGALPSNSFVRLRGLPPSISLSGGHAIGPGSWAIPLFGLPALKANVPAGVSGRSEIIINLVAVDGTLLAEARTALVVGPAAMLAPPEQKRAGTLTAPAPAVAPPTPVPAVRPERGGQPTPRPPELSAEVRGRAEKLISQGERFLQQGSIVLAREFFRRAADAGLAQGAIRLAATYDPGELQRLQAQGVVPDRAEARKWYERARELGAPEAEERLARLGGS